MFASINSGLAIKKSLESHGVISKVLPNFDIPESLSLVIEYASKHPVALGNTLSVDSTQERPELKLVDATETATASTDSLYTLLLTDPDAPSQSDNKWSEYCHYIERNIKLSPNPEVRQSLDLNAGEVLVPYMGPGPPKGTGPHRYVWILAEQAKDKVPEKVSDRPNWGFNKPGAGFRQYAELFGLKPVAVNFFYAENK